MMKAKKSTVTSTVKSSAKKVAPKKSRSAKVAPSSTEGANFEKFFIDELKDLYWAEKTLIKTLPKMQKAATSKKLQEAFKYHEVETRQHVQNLEKIFDIMNVKPAGKKCDAMAGIVAECKSIIEDTKRDTMIRDAGLILAGQKAEHYEIATYGTMRVFANHMKRTDVAVLIQQNLDSEKAADATLTSIAESYVNERAAVE